MNIERRAIVIVLLVLTSFVLMAFVSTTNTHLNDNDEYDYTSRDDGPVKGASVELHPKSLYANDNHGADPLLPSEDYHVNISVHSDAFGYSNLSYDNLVLCVYDSNGTVLQSEPVGQIRSPSSGRFHEKTYVNMTFQTTPKYFLVDHPGIRTDDRVGSDIFYWDNNTDEWHMFYTRDFSDKEDEFEWPRTSEVGKCG